MGSLVNILWTVAVILIVLWLLGLVFGLAAGAFGWLLHLLLVVAIIVIAYNLLTGRKTV
ncbi:MAG: lmo0937 family membrane protein [Chloroflexota bacterium]